MTEQYANEQELLLSQMRARAKKKAERIEDVTGAAALMGEIKESEADASEERRGLFADAGVGIFRAIPGAAEEFFDLVSSLDDSVMESFGTTFGDIRFNMDEGFRLVSPSDYLKDPARSLLRIPEDGWKGIKEMFPETERGSGGFIEPAVKFTLGFLGGKMWLKGAGLLQGTGRAAQIGNAAISGAAADVSVFDGHDARLSDFLQSFDNPVFNNMVTEYLASDAEDTELHGRMKSLIEGGILGIMADGIMLGIRGMWRFKHSKSVAEARKRSDELSIVMKDTEIRAEPKVPEVDAPVKKVEEVGADLDPAAKQARENAAIEVSVRDAVKITHEQAVAFKNALEEGDEKAAMESLQDFNEKNIDWAAMENGHDIKQVMLVTEKLFYEMIDKVKGGVQTNQQTKMLANLVGESSEDVTKLFRDVRGDKGIAARLYAAHRVMLASAQEVKRLALVAKTTKAPVDEAAVLRQVQLHVAIQAEYKGSTTEIARALQSMGILKGQVSENFREFADLKRQFGTNTSSSRAFEKYMDDLLESGLSLDALNSRVRMGAWERATNIFVEYTLNSMLSSIKTHVINLTSNVLNTFLYSLDRTVGGAYRAVALGDKAAWREAKIDMHRKVVSLDMAWKLARQAWVDGAPVVDKRQRIEFLTRQAIHMEGDGFFAAGINALGTMTRIPGRLLITGDEFFKAINREAEIHVLSFRKADEEAVAKGLEYATDAYESFVTKRTIELIDPKGQTLAHRDIRTKAIEKARLTTFQESPVTEKIGPAMEGFINSNPYMKLAIAPFFRTPMNILRQGLLDRTPLGLVLKAHRATIRGGGREAAEAIARMTSGVAAMSAFYAIISNTDETTGFEVVGKIPYDSSKKAAGVKDYSIRIGDQWYQFNRLEPLGMWLGMVVDMKTHADYQTPGVGDEPTFAFIQAAMGAFMNNVSNKTWAKTLSDFIEMTEGMSTGKPHAVERAANRFAAGEFGKLIPQLVKSVGKAIDEGVTGEDPMAREAWTLLDAISAQLPVLNRSLPPRHDPLGREITWEAGALAIINPFAISKNPDTPINKEMFRLSFTIRPMPKSLAAGSVQLTNVEYSTLTKLVGSTGLEEILDGLITSDGWDDIPDPMKVSMLKVQITRARKTAVKLLLARPEVRKRMTGAQLNAIFLLIGQDTQEF